jgi:hypothetical protein
MKLIFVEKKGLEVLLEMVQVRLGTVQCTGTQCGAALVQWGRPAADGFDKPGMCWHSC